jgi:hypothetical protein
VSSVPALAATTTMTTNVVIATDASGRTGNARSTAPAAVRRLGIDVLL